MRYIFLFCLYAIPLYANCQEISKEVKSGIIRGHIRGHIIDKTDTFALEGATVTLLVNSATNNYLTQISDVNGEFTFVIPDSLIKKRLKISVRCVGCAEKTIVLKKTQLPINDLRIVIEPYVIDDDFE